MLDIPANPPSPAWDFAWLGYELHCRAEGFSAKTIINRKSTIGMLARWCTGQAIEPEAVTRSVLTRYLVASYADRTASGPCTAFQDLKSFWAWWGREEGQPSPMAGIPRPKGRARLVPVLTPAQIEAVLEACKTPTPRDTVRNRAMVWLMLESGLRRFELAALDIEDVDLRAGTVVVRCGKNSKARVSVFGDDTAMALHRWLKIRGATDGALFTSKFGRLTKWGVGDVIKRIGQRAGVQVRPHMFRHAFAHYSLASGIQEGDLMVVAGWSTRSMIDRYGAALKQERAIAAVRSRPVGKLLRGR